MIQFLAALQGMATAGATQLAAAKTAVASSGAGQAASGAMGAMTDLSGMADKMVAGQEAKLNEAFKDSSFGKSGFAKGTGLDGLFEPSADPRVASHGRAQPMQTGDGVGRFMSVNAGSNNPSVGSMVSSPAFQSASIPYATSGSISEQDQNAALYDQQTADAVAEVIAADQTLPDAPLVQPTNYEHGSLYSPRKDVVSVDDFINNRGR